MVESVYHQFVQSPWEMLTIFTVIISLITAFDYMICRKIFNLSSGTGGGARWFIIHAICNMWIVWTAFPDFYLVFFDPITALEGSSMCSMYPFLIQNALHIYHMIEYYRELTYSDWLHHIAMVIVGGPLVCFQMRTPAINAIHMFMIGIPGAIDYCMLAATKLGLMQSHIEKSINTHINVWLRSPGILIGTVFAYIHACYLYSKPEYEVTTFQLCIVAPILALNYWNAQYFMERVVASHHVLQYKMNYLLDNKTELMSEEL